MTRLGHARPAGALALAALAACAGPGAAPAAEPPALAPADPSEAPPARIFADLAAAAPIPAAPRRGPAGRVEWGARLRPSGAVAPEHGAGLDVEVAGLALDGETSLRAAMRALAAASGVSILVKRDAEEAFADAGGELDLELEHPLALRRALDLVCELAGADVTWTVRHGVVLVTTDAGARTRPVTRIWDVQDLVRGVPDFVAPAVDLRPSELRDDRAGSVERRVPHLEPDTLLELVRAVLPPAVRDDPRTSVTLENGRLIVTTWER